MGLKVYPEYMIKELEGTDLFEPSNKYLCYVYVVPSTQDYIWVDNQVEPPTFHGNGIGNVCMGQIYDRMSDEEKDKFHKLIDSNPNFLNRFLV